jgi:hypothetical protein
LTGSIGSDVQRRFQVLAIIQAQVGDQREPAASADQRLAIVNILRQNPKQAPAKGNLAPVPLIARMRSIEGLRGQHPRA